MKQWTTGGRPGESWGRPKKPADNCGDFAKRLDLGKYSVKDDAQDD